MGPYHRPSHESIPHHQILDQGTMDLAHMLVVIFFAEVRAAVGADGPAEEALGRGGRCGFHTERGSCGIWQAIVYQ